MIKDLVCKQDCCILRYCICEDYVIPIKYYKKRKKAGMFIYDPVSDEILIVQSRWNLWGCPKGSLEEGETYESCAIREVNEETGISFSKENLGKRFKIYGNAVYFYMKVDKNQYIIQNLDNDDEITGIGWIKKDCFKDLIETGKISVTKHCLILLKKLTGISFNNF